MVNVDGTYELERDSFAEKLMKAIKKGGTEIVEVQHILLHQHHRAFHSVAVVFAVSAAGDGVDDVLKHLRSRKNTNLGTVAG